MAKDNDPAPSATLPPQTLERWRQIVRRAALGGADVSQLVQHFAERSFQNKTLDLDTQGTRRRALTQMRAVVQRELSRSETARTKLSSAKSQQLSRAYEGISIVFAPQQATAQSKRSQAHAVPMALDGATQASKSSPLTQKITTLADLDSYSANLRQQIVGLELEMSQIDAVLNRGIVNHQSTVDELSATSVALWRVAQEVMLEIEAELPNRRGPQAPVALAADEKTAAMPIAEGTAPAPVPAAGPAGELLRAMQTKVGELIKRLTSPPSGGNRP